MTRARALSPLDGETRRRLDLLFEAHMPTVGKAALRRAASKAEADDLVAEVQLYALQHPEKLLERMGEELRSGQRAGSSRPPS